MRTVEAAALACWEAGNEACARSEWSAATHAYSEAVRIAPDFGEAYVGLGVALGQGGLWTESAAAQRRALELMPGDYEASFNLGVALAELKDFAGAETCFRDATRAQADAETRLRLGWALAEQSKCAEALAEFETIVASQPDHAEAHAAAARELAHFGRHGEARAALARVRALQPALFDDWEELRRLDESLGGG